VSGDSNFDGNGNGNSNGNDAASAVNEDNVDDNNGGI
jgi:hypothetical protein